MGVWTLSQRLFLSLKLTKSHINLGEGFYLNPNIYAIQNCSCSTVLVEKTRFAGVTKMVNNLQCSWISNSYQYQGVKNFTLVAHPTHVSNSHT